MRRIYACQSDNDALRDNAENKVRGEKTYQGSKRPVGEPLTMDAPLCAYAPPYEGIDTADDEDDDEEEGVPAPPMVGKKRR